MSAVHLCFTSNFQDKGATTFRHRIILSEREFDRYCQCRSSQDVTYLWQASPLALIVFHVLQPFPRPSNTAKSEKHANLVVQVKLFGYFFR